MHHTGSGSKSGSHLTSYLSRPHSTIGSCVSMFGRNLSGMSVNLPGSTSSSSHLDRELGAWCALGSQEPHHLKERIPLREEWSIQGQFAFLFFGEGVLVLFVFCEGLI